jgi:hypothetical protein
MLNAFLELGLPKEVATFASRWGLLGICEHGIPAEHKNIGRLELPSTFMVGRAGVFVAVDQDCTSSALNEPLGPWFYWSAVAGATLRVAEALRDGRRTAEADWKVLAAPGPWVVESRYWEKANAFATSGVELVQASRQDQKAALAEALSRWLGLTAIHPIVVWEGGLPEIRVPDADLFGSLALAIILAVGDMEGWGVCPGCGRQFVPPRGGRRATYCSTCRSDGVSRRLASKRYRALQKSSDPDFLIKERERVRRLRQQAKARREQRP